MTAAMTLQDISVERGGAFIVRDLSLSVEDKCWLGVIGANGSGKTTLLWAMAGRLHIASGQCRIGDTDVTADRAARADRIGFMPPIEHSPTSLPIHRLLTLAGGVIEDQQQRNHQLWAALGIHDLLPRQIGVCSAGMRQRAAIAIAFARPAGIVILDEPFNWLDPVAAFDLRSALANGRVSLCQSVEDLRRGQRDIVDFESRMIASLRSRR